MELSQDPKSGQTWWSYLKIQKVARPGGVISKSKKWPDLVELSQNPKSGQIWWSYLKIQKVARPSGVITKLQKW